MTDNAVLLQSIQTINDTIAKVNNSCDHDCLMEKQRSDLKKKYLDAERNYKNAPEKLSQAEHNYLLDKDGPKKYNEVLRTRFSNNANQEIQKLKEEHNMIMNEINLGNSQIEKQNMSIDNLTQYDNMLTLAKPQAELATSNAGENESVSSRKIFYMETKIQTVSWWYYLIRNLYWVCAFVWLLVYVIYYRKFNNQSILIFILIVAYPFFMVWLFTAAYSMCKYIIQLFPKDVYLNF